MSARKFDISKAKKYGNVTVRKTSEHDGLYTEVLLHGNRVVLINHTAGYFELDHCGWITPTTRTAINTALSQFRPDARVFIERGTMFVSWANGEDEGLLVPGAKYGFEVSEVA
jgi:hypothetical protein